MENSLDLISIASKFVNSTSRHIFLTGKAGTGKTTFLRELAQATHKPHVIVAPTGIAALNANGVTIHSQFQVPPGSFIPDRDYKLTSLDEAGFFTARSLAMQHPISRARRQVLRSISLLIIDEVSMLRADLLDCIDQRLRSVRGNFRQSFGGVQVLMIGDLNQLPPVVKDHEWNILSKWYASPHFFEAKALLDEGFVHIELEKVFRQQDELFIRLLNNLRNNTLTQADLDTLNQYYRPDAAQVADGAVTLTTHNHSADSINQAELEKLAGKTFTYKASITGDFPESAYPVLPNLVLKVGAQVMFVKNDTSDEKVYYNGMLAKVLSLSDETIEVLLKDNGQRYHLKPDRWDNKKYKLNERTKEMEEEVVGSFLQYPIKLAWAITVHKSQGLTFDRAIIDVGRAFAPGQVYVALSRLRSLEGLVLRTPVRADVVTTDPVVSQFGKRKHLQPPLPHLLALDQSRYLRQMLHGTFSFSQLIHLVNKHVKDDEGSLEFADPTMRSAPHELLGALKADEEVANRFRHQVEALLAHGNGPNLLDRVNKASAYFSEKMSQILTQLLLHRAKVAGLSKTKALVEALDEIDLATTMKWGEIRMAAHIVECITLRQEVTKRPGHEQELKDLRTALEAHVMDKLGDRAQLPTNRSGRVRKRKADNNRMDGPSERKPKPEKGATQRESIELFKKGLTMAQVAEARGLKESTIEGHLSVPILNGELNLFEILPDEISVPLLALISDKPDKSTSEIHALARGQYTHGQIRMAINHLQRVKSRE